MLMLVIPRERSFLGIFVGICREVHFLVMMLIPGGRVFLFQCYRYFLGIFCGILLYAQHGDLGTPVMMVMMMMIPRERYFLGIFLRMCREFHFLVMMVTRGGDDDDDDDDDGGGGDDDYDDDGDS